MKMSKNIKITNRVWASAVALMLIAPSCDLEIQESDSFITAEEISFGGVTNVGGALDNIYNNISGQTGDQANLYALTEVTTDELLVPTRGTDWGDNGIWRTLHAHTWGPTHPYIVNVWNEKNSAVLRASEVIHPLSNAGATDLAQAKFVRAYNMWIVMDFYGQVPYREPDDGPEVIPSVMTRAEAYDFVVKDLEDAIAGLPASAPTAANKFRAGKAHAKFLLAKVKLNANVYKGEYGAGDLQDVIDLVDEIEAEGYGLVEDYFGIFKGPNFTNNDVIWNVPAGMGNRAWNSLHYNQAELIENFPGAGTNAGGGWNGFTTMAEFYDKFEGPAETNAIGSGQEERRGWVHTEASTNADNEGFGYGFQFGQMWGWRDGDAVALTTRSGDPLIFTKELPGLIGNNEVTGIRLLKYSPANGSFTSGVVMARFADAHLMRAEANLRLGNSAEALAQVNELRAMRENTPPLSSLSEADLLDERARELYTEGWRRNDLVRFGMFKGSWEFKDGEATADGHTDLFPIPASALLTNPGLVQNPGY